MVAFRARRFVCTAIILIASVTLLISLAARSRAFMVAVAWWAISVALAVTCEPPRASRAMASKAAVASWVAWATALTLAAAVPADVEMVVTLTLISSLADEM